MTDLLRRKTAAALILLGVWGVAPLVQARQSADRGSDTGPFAADVVVERLTVQPDGVVVQRLPKVRYRLSQRSGPHGLVTEIRFHATPPFPGRGPLQDPSAGFRVMLSEGDGIQVFDPDGTPVPARRETETRPGARAELGLPDSFPSELTMSPSGTARRLALTARYGRPVGNHGQYERFVRSEGDTLEEVLVDPQTALPVEINAVKTGRLVLRTWIEYSALADGRLYRASQRDETLTDPGDPQGLRSVTTTTYTPLRGGDQ